MDAATLREWADYDAETGIMTWRKSNSNRAYAGDRFGANIDSKGYFRACLLGKQYRTHRLAWLHYYGELPKGMIDHINRDRLDNRVANLRLADATLNARNISGQCNNTSGFRGVTRRSDGKKWVAQITDGYKNHYLGSFSDIEQAVAARKKAEQELWRASP